MDIILASQSPRRKELMGQIGLKFKVISPNVDEHMEGNPSPAQLVEELSLRKARAVERQADGEALIVAADTVVALEGTVLGKPEDEREAYEKYYSDFNAAMDVIAESGYNESCREFQQEVLSQYPAEFIYYNSSVYGPSVFA